MVRALLLAALAMTATAVTPVKGATATPAPSPAAATAAFGRLLHQLYGEMHGYWTCPPPAILGRIDCLAEVRAGREWHQLAMSARRRTGEIVLTTSPDGAAHSWARRWTPYSRHFILRSNEPQVPGVVSVNSPAYDWGWLAGLAHGLKAGQTRRLSALDGDASGLERFFVFTCTARGTMITCRNALGDGMRYRP